MEIMDAIEIAPIWGRDEGLTHLNLLVVGSSSSEVAYIWGFLP